MPAMESLTKLIVADIATLTKSEQDLLEIEIFSKVFSELKIHFRKLYKEYFKLLKFTSDKENDMIENQLLRLIIDDILATNEYTFDGIAYYTDTPPEVVQELYMGLNQNPSALFMRKISDLHRLARPGIYFMISKKITADYLVTHLVDYDAKGASNLPYD